VDHDADGTDPLGRDRSGAKRAPLSTKAAMLKKLSARRK